MASAFGIPLNASSVAPAPACIAAPAGPIGTAAEAAEAQRKPSASGNDPLRASAFKRRKTAVPRSAHETEIRPSAAADSLRFCVCWPSQRPRRKRTTWRVAESSWQEGNHHGCEDTGHRHDQEAGADGPGACIRERDPREGRQRRAVEHADDDQAEADRAETRLRAREAAHAGDADRVVDPAGHCNAADARRGAGKSERIGPRPNIFFEEALPAPRLEGVGDEEEGGRGADEDRIRLLQRPAVFQEMLRAEDPDREEHECEAAVEGDLDFPIGEMATHLDT